MRFAWRPRRRCLLGGSLALACAGPLGALSAFAADAAPALVLVLSDDGTQLRSFDAAELRPRRTLSLPAGRWRRLFVQADGHALLVADDGAVLRVAPGATALLAHAPGADTMADAALGDAGRMLLVALRAPAELRLFDALTLRVLKRWPLATVDGRIGAAGAEVHDAPARRSFVVAPADLPELWEISCDPHAEDQYEGLVHDFRMGEGVPVRGYLHARRTRLPQPLQQLALDAAGLLVIGAAPGGALQGYNLDARRRAARWTDITTAQPRAGAWAQRGPQAWLAMPDASRPLVHWLHPDGEPPLPPLMLPAPARWLRWSPAGPWLWAATDDALLRVEIGSGSASSVLAAGPLRDLQFLPGGREACVLSGGASPALHRLDLASGRLLARQPVAGAVALALDLHTGPTGLP